MDDPQRVPRRWFLAGGLALVAGAGAGVASGFVQPDRTRTEAAVAPSTLRAALSDERQLVAVAEAALASGVVARSVANALLRDHRAHLAALEAAAVRYRTTSRRTAAVEQLDRAAIISLESRAASRAATRADRFAGEPSATSLATLLASISACEATHAQLLDGGGAT